MTWTIHNGDCLEVLRTLADCSVDAVVTDPPYGLSFMGKRWDYDVPSVDVWAECLRVLKPGGHLLAFAGTRTQHRMAVRIEDAGFEIRDMIAWVYGSGFPKSLDVSKAIDKAGGARAGFAQFRDAVKDAMRRNGVSRKSLQSALGNYMLSHYLTAGAQPAVPNYRDYAVIRDHVGLGNAFDDLFAPEAEREVVGRSENGIAGGTGKHAGQDAAYGFAGEFNITAPATPEARQWQGWGTALKPALEPITVARKPLSGTVAENVLTHGTGAINVDGCRVGCSGESLRGGGVGTRSDGWDRPWKADASAVAAHKAKCDANADRASTLGRWPANVIHDGSEEPTSLLGDASRFFYCAKASKADRDEGCEGLEFRTAGEMVDREEGSAGIQNPRAGAGRTGGARNGHPTVKPAELMRYLCRLVTPPSGVVLDPFTGSGSTGKAAILERFNFIGIEREAEYCEIARARISKAERDVSKELL